MRVSMDFKEFQGKISCVRCSVDDWRSKVLDMNLYRIIFIYKALPFLSNEPFLSHVPMKTNYFLTCKLYCIPEQARL